jgi:DNA-binding MarR family transcriptional regulator
MKDPLDSLPGYLLRRASAASLSELNQRLMPLQLRHIDASLLLLINANPDITQSDAGRMLDIQRANMVPLIARLETQGLVSRRQVDGRSQALFLTPVGQDVLKEAQHLVETYEAELTSRVPAEMQAHIVPILRALWGRPGRS